MSDDTSNGFNYGLIGAAFGVVLVAAMVSVMDAGDRLNGIPNPESTEYTCKTRNHADFVHLQWRLKNIEAKLDRIENATAKPEKPSSVVRVARD